MMRRKLINHIYYFLFCIVLCIPKSVLAINDSERNELTRLLKELDVIVSMIPKAKRTADKQNDIQFDYEALIIDIEAVKQGISDYVNSSKRNPRKLPAIDGSYRQ